MKEIGTLRECLGLNNQKRRCLPVTSEHPGYRLGADGQLCDSKPVWNEARQAATVVVAPMYMYVVRIRYQKPSSHQSSRTATHVAVCELPTISSIGPRSSPTMSKVGDSHSDGAYFPSQTRSRRDASMLARLKAAYYFGLGLSVTRDA